MSTLRAQVASMIWPVIMILPKRRVMALVSLLLVLVKRATG